MEKMSRIFTTRALKKVSGHFGAPARFGGLGVRTLCPVGLVDSVLLRPFEEFSSHDLQCGKTHPKSVCCNFSG